MENKHVLRSGAFMIHWHRYTISIALAGILLIAGQLFAGDVRLSWPSNSESDLAGYQIYYGTTSNNYLWTVNVHNVTQYTIQNLNENTQYYFALTAYDQSGNESSKSPEYSFLVKDIAKPTLDTVYAVAADRIVVKFSEPVEINTAEIENNYSIRDNPNIIVQNAELQSDLKTVYLNTLSHPTGNYTLTVNNVRDRAATPNTIEANSTFDYTYTSDDQLGPTVIKHDLFDRSLLVLEFSEALQSSSALDSANYSFSPTLSIDQINFIDSESRKVGIYTSLHTQGQSYTLLINNVTDVQGNAILPNTSIQYICESGDVTPPSLIAARAVSSTLIELEFSETLNQTSAQTISKYSIRNQTTQQIISIGTALLSSNTKVQLTTAEHITGNYLVTVSNIADIYDNAMGTASLTYPYIEPDIERPMLVKAELSGNQLLKIYFNEPIDEGSGTYTANYQINPAISITRAYVVHDSIVFLETGSHSPGTYTVVVSNVFDQANPPNQIGYVDNQATYTYVQADQIAPVLLSAKLHGANFIELAFSEAMEITAGETLDNYSIIESGSGLSIAVNSVEVVRPACNRIYLHTADHTPGKSYTISISNLTDQATPANAIQAGSSKTYSYPLIDNLSPQLTDATLSGDRNLLLTFSEPMDPASLQGSGNYAIEPTVQINEILVMQSQLSVMLVTESHTPSKTPYQITVQNVTDISGNVIAAMNQKTYICQAVDNAAPVFQYAFSRGANTVELCFDEPLEESSATNTKNYSIDNGITIEKAELSNSGMEVFLQTSTHFKGGAYTIIAKNIDDRAASPHTMSLTERLYTYAPLDTVAPVFLSAEIINSTMIALYFNEAIDNESAKNPANYVLSNGIGITHIVNDQSQYIVYLTTTVHQTDGAYSVQASNLADNTTSQNKMKTAATKTYHFVKNDVSGPEVLKAKCISESVVVITFDEALEATSATDLRHYSIHNDTKSIEVKDADLSPDQSQVTLSTGKHTPGQYTLTLNNIKDNSANANFIEPYTPVSYTWNPADSTKPKLLGAEAFGDRNVKLTFSEYMSNNGVSDTSNYSIEPRVKVNMAVLDGGNPYVIWLYTESHANDVYTIKVKNLKDLAFNPNVIDPANNSAVYQYEAPDTTTPSVVAVQCKSGGWSVQVSFSEPVERSSALKTLNYQIAGIEINSATLAGDNSTVVLETSKHTGNKTYTCIVSNVKDRASNPNIMTSPDSVDYQYIPPDDVSPTLKGVKLVNSTELQMEFSEELEATSAETRKNYYIDGMTVIRARLKEGNAKVVILTTASEHYSGIGYTVVVYNVQDLAGNVIKAGESKGYEMDSTNPSDYNDQAAPQVVRVEMLSDVSMRIVFSEAVDKTTAQKTEHYYIGDGIQILKAVLDSNLTRVTLSTTPHSSSQSYHIQISGIQDRASTPNTMSTSDQIGYIYSKGVGLSCLSRPSYTFSVASQNGPMYVDRSYTFIQFPDDLNGTLQIQTANADKSSSGTEFLTFELTGSGNLFIAYDAQIDSLPSWLKTWKVTGLQVVNSHDDVFNVYSKTFTDDQIVLGGNYGSDDDNMYLAFVKPFATGSGLIASLSKASYKTSYIAIGEEYYLDRSAYKLASLPDTLKDLMWIKTANDDKMAEEDEFLKIQITAESKIFIGYDSRVKRQNMPDWISGWTKEEGQIVDSRANKFDIYSQQFEAGEVILGGNEGAAENNMYLILVERLGGNEPVNYSHMPGFFTLSQNYPNPFNPDTKIQYTVHKPGRVTITIYNILGQQVKILLDEMAEEYGLGGEVIWDGTNSFGIPVASGIYIYRVKQHQFSITKRMVLVR